MAVSRLHALRGLLLVGLLGIVPLAGAATLPATARQPVAIGAPISGHVRLPGHVLDVAQQATRLPVRPSNDSLHLTVVLSRDDAAGFEAYRHDVYDPHSPRYRQFLSPAELTRRFGPSAQTYERLSRFLRANGLAVTTRSANRLTLSVQGSRSSVERAFALEIADFSAGDRRFFANIQDPALPAALAGHVQAVTGLSNLATPVSSVAIAKDFCAVLVGITSFRAWRLGDNLSWAQRSVDLAKQLNFAEAKVQFEVSAEAARLTAGYAARIAAYVGATCVGVVVGSDVGDQLDNAYGGGGPPGPDVFPGLRVRPWVMRLWNAYGAPRQPDYGVDAFESTVGPVTFPTPNSFANRAFVQAQRRAAAAATDGPADGTGQVVGLLEFDSFVRQDVVDFLSLSGLPRTQINQLSTVHVNGGVARAGANQREVLLDIDTVMSLAPGARVAVYDLPFTGRAADYAAGFNAMINGGVTVISNSWTSCEDQVSAADAAAIDAVLATAAAAGITVLNAAGDTGSTCVNGSGNTVGVPADSPNATAVGGTSFTFGPGYTYGSETWWGQNAGADSDGRGGFGTSRYFTRPAYQAGLNPGSMRSVPDVAIVADPNAGGIICQASAGGCPTGLAYGGTSYSAPVWASVVAILNSKYSRNLGALNPQIYPLAATSAFHSAASMGSDFFHVGLGSPNVAALGQRLSGKTAGTVDPTQSYVDYLGSLAPDGSARPAPVTLTADGHSTAVITVRLFDGNSTPVAGKTVSLSANSGAQATIVPAQATTDAGGTASFKVTDATVEALVLTANDVTDGMPLTTQAGVFFVSPPATSAGLNVGPTSVPADGQSAATLTVTLTDASGHPSLGKAVRVNSTGHAQLVGPANGRTDVNGQIRFSVTDQYAETVTLSAIDITDGALPVPGTGTVTFSGTASAACNATTPPVAAAGYLITPFITGLPAAATLFYGDVNFGCPGATPPGFSPDGRVLVGSALTGQVFKSGPTGGNVTSSDVIGTFGPTLGPVVYGKDGAVYAARAATGSAFTSGAVLQIDPSTGTVARTVASGLTCPANLAVDPLSGDLFFDDICSGAGSDDPTLYRIVDPAGTDTARPTAVVAYARLPSTPNGGLAFSPDGTLYAVTGYFASTGGNVVRVSGTNSASVLVTPIAGVTSSYWLAVGASNADGSASTLLLDHAGALVEVPLSNPAAPVTISPVSAGVGSIGPDGCLYAARYDTIFKLTRSDGTCRNDVPSNPSVSIRLAAPTGSGAQGTPQSFVATVKNLTPGVSVPVLFTITGANHTARLVSTDSTGTATLKFTPLAAGTDVVIAQVPTAPPTLTSNPVRATWSAGRKVTMLTLGASARAANVGMPVLVSATLTTLSASSAAPVAGESVTLTLAGSSCTAVTSAQGVASCALSASQAGTSTLVANYAGTANYAPSADAADLTVATAVGPPPTVTLSASPTSVVSGTSVTLTWSSSNATSCAASGSWTGARATSGSEAVVPAGVANYQYTLTCSGDGGMASAVATVSATLAPVTVTAKSGGGSLGYGSLFVIALLGLLRAALRRPAGAGAALLVGLILAGVAVPSPARAQAAADTSGRSYIGLRIGGMPVRVDNDALAYQLSGVGLQSVSVSSSSTSVAGTLYGGYFFTTGLAAEVGYTHRDATLVTLTGTLPSAASSQAAAQSTANLLRGYGDAYTLSLTGRPRIRSIVTLSPRLGLLYWTTQINASAGSASVRETHSGGGLTAGLGVSVSVWRELSLGVAVDHFRGSPTNLATLYSGTVEWRWGRPGP